MKQYHCIVCKAKIQANTWFKGSKRCIHCTLKGRKRLDVSKRFSGENHPNYIDGRTLENHYCKELICNNKISYKTWKYGQGRCRSCSKRNRRPANPIKGKLHGNYIEGLIRTYPNKFNKKLKESIRIRDNHRCQICGKLQIDCNRKLDIHHIDYDKDNLNPNNLISLCQGCHIKTNGNRGIYIEFFEILKNILYN